MRNVVFASFSLLLLGCASTQDPKPVDIPEYWRHPTLHLVEAEDPDRAIESAIHELEHETGVALVLVLPENTSEATVRLFSGVRRVVTLQEAMNWLPSGSRYFVITKCVVESDKGEIAGAVFNSTADPDLGWNSTGYTLDLSRADGAWVAEVKWRVVS